jgi:hypothetical protein
MHCNAKTCNAAFGSKPVTLNRANVVRLAP